METNSDELPKAKKPMGRPRIYEDRRKYNRDYYHEHKDTCRCTCCDKDFTCKSSLNRHQAKNLKCAMKKMQRYMDELREQLPNAEMQVYLDELRGHTQLTGNLPKPETT